jgi:copper resistance protein B
MGLLGVWGTSIAGGPDDPILAKVMIDQFEYRATEGPDPLILEADAWIGKDLHKAWFKVDAERVNNELEELEVQALYSRAVAPFWDLQVGIRHDARPRPTRTWAALGFKGLAPYWFEVDAAAFVNKEGQVNLRASAEYEWMFTQQIALAPELEFNAYSKDDPDHEIGAGLSDMQAGIRLRYEIKREFAPYIGVNWNRKLGETADIARSSGEDIDDVQFVVGIHAWF